MKKIFRTMTMTLGAAVVALAFGATAHAGGPHFYVDMHLPLPPLPPIPVPFGRVDVVVPTPEVYAPAPEVYAPDYGPTVYAPEYRTVYRGYDRHARRDYWRHERRAWREDRRDRRDAHRDWRQERRDWRHGRGRW